MKMTSTDRVLLLLTGILAAYQVAVGINGLDEIPIIAYTIAFGVLLVAGLLLIILGFEALDSPIVVVVSTVIPLALSLGLVWQHIASLRTPYLIFAIGGFLAVTLTRSIPVPGKLPTFVLAIVHGIAGMTIFLLPSILAANGTMKPGFALVGLGGAMIGLAGLLLSFLKAGKPIVPRSTILKILPSLLLLMTICFVAGFKLG
ncbi:MAG: hypothetical protein ACOYYF_08660 [Chloroflexota bacterium]|nr:hypothetical protein [Chloroflexota bacterium]MBI5702150.1 hypothetical protein [Chloroflexota bacterium]